MNPGRNVTTAANRDSLTTAIIKNVITVALCISINSVNGILLHTFQKHQILNTNPRYILYIHLIINDVIQLTMFTLLQVLSYILFTFNVSVCIALLVVALFTTYNNPLTLAVMAVECHVAVCYPLRSSQICTVKKTYLVISLIWATSAFSFLPDIFFILTTKSWVFFQSRVFCIGMNTFRNAHMSAFGDAYNTVLLVVVWLTLLYTYLRIIFTAQAATANAKKARNTILLHGFQLLLCMLTYIYRVLIEVLTGLFPQQFLTIVLIVAIMIHILPRLISPLVYGLRDKTFRSYVKKVLSS